MQASNPTVSMIPEVITSARVTNATGNCPDASVIPTISTPLPTAMPLPTSQAAFETMLASIRPELAPSAERRPISRMRRATLTDTSE